MGFIPSVAGLVVLIVGEDTVHVVLHDPDCMWSVLVNESGADQMSLMVLRDVKELEKENYEIHDIEKSHL